MKYVASIPGKRLRKETRSSLVRIGKEVASLTDIVAEILATSGFTYSDESGKSYEIKVSRTAAKVETKDEEI